jgi:predicted dehydrogenase
LAMRQKTEQCVNAALLGYGFAGKTFHAPLLSHVPGLRLSHIVSSDEAKVREDWDVTVLSTPEDAFEMPEIDLIVIATPNPTHFDLARKALLNNKHVVVDKPFTITVREAEELITLARSRGRLLSVFHERRWDGDFLTLRELVSGGALGEITLFESHYDRYRPAVRDRWRERDIPGSGIWFDLGSHLVDQALELFGLPERICADLEMQRAGSQAVDYFHVVLKYGRRRVILHGGSFVMGETPRFVVQGVCGNFKKYGMDTQEDSLKRGEVPGGDEWGLDPRMGTLVVSREHGFETSQVPNMRGNYLAYYEGIQNAIVCREPNPVPAEEALQVINVLETAMRSNAAHAEIPLPQIKI